jgi:WD40 repeat protein
VLTQVPTAGAKVRVLTRRGVGAGRGQVYDVRKSEDKRVLESTFTSGKHSDAVWELVWVDKGSERGEALVSVSSDGRVSLWTMSKGLENSDLIKLKRVASHKKAAAAAGAPPAAQPNTKKEAFISRCPCPRPLPLLCVVWPRPRGSPQTLFLGAPQGAPQGALRWASTRPPRAPSFCFSLPRPPPRGAAGAWDDDDGC